MAHAKLNLQVMFDWISATLDAGHPMPTDGEICERFGFTSPEQARTLLAELADAGRITIKGYGATRQISLGRVRSALAAAARAEPAVKRADPEVERTTARLVEIVQRGRKPAAAIAAENAAQLLSTVTKPAAPAAAKPAKEPPMAGKTIQLPASSTTAIAAVERLAKEDDITFGQAAAELIGRGAKLAASSEPPAAPTIASVIADLHAVFDSLVTHAGGVRAAEVRAEAAEARAADAEKLVAKFKELLA